jgi:hypothetical protein
LYDKAVGVGVDISASSITEFPARFFTKKNYLINKIIFGFEIFSKKVGFRGLKLKVKLKSIWNERYQFRSINFFYHFQNFECRHLSRNTAKKRLISISNFF